MEREVIFSEEGAKESDGESVTRYLAGKKKEIASFEHEGMHMSFFLLVQIFWGGYRMSIEQCER